MNKTILAIMVILISCGGSAGSGDTNNSNRRTISSENIQKAKDIVEELIKHQIHIIDKKTINKLEDFINDMTKEDVVKYIVNNVEYAKNTVGFNKLTDEAKVTTINNIVDALLIRDKKESIIKTFEVFTSFAEKDDYIKYIYENLSKEQIDANKDFENIITFIKGKNSELTDEQIKARLVAINISIAKNDKLFSFFFENVKSDNEKEIESRKNYVSEIKDYVSKIDKVEIIKLGEEDKNKKIEDITNFLKECLKEEIKDEDIKKTINSIIKNVKNTFDKIDKFVDLAMYSK